MKTRLLLLATTLAALSASAAPAQTGRPPARSLQPFRSEAELTRFVNDLLPPPPRSSTCASGADVKVSQSTPAAKRDSVIIRGRVTAGGSALQGAQVRVQGYAAGAVTSATGVFRLALPAAHVRAKPRVTLQVARVGYGSAARTFTVVPGNRAAANFALCAQVTELQGVAVAAAAPALADNRAESVTNVQHAGVDEGGIVKSHGDHLVILRRGRLFTVRIGDDRLTPVSVEDAFGPDIDPSSAWYDELLISGDVVMVIGYSYQRGGTEVGLFRIDRAGRLAHRSTYQLRSNDYYSSRNYASRLVEGKLVFYAPLALRGHGRRDGQDITDLLPSLRRWRKGSTEDGFKPIASATRVYRPARELERGGNVALHTVTTCDVSRAEMDCQATAVFGPWGHTFYVSPHSVYVWLSGWRRTGESTRAPAMLYRMPLDGSAPSALGVAGSPIDQFSFLESTDNHLNVLVRADGAGQWMWRAERPGGSLALLRFPLAGFGDGREDVPLTRYRALPSPEEGALQNRFVGNHLLYGTGSGWGRPRSDDGSELYVVQWRNGGVSELPLAHPVDRIEALGSGAVIVGSDEGSLHFTSVQLAGRPAPVDRYTMRGASQGETRSHGFFYRADDERTGVLGLPVRGPGRPGYEHLFIESASILFLRNQSLRLAEMGELDAQPERAGDDGCRASCVDWYGNARPLFLRGRIFALLGYELVEGSMQGGRIREVQRTSFAPVRMTRRE